MVKEDKVDKRTIVSAKRLENLKRAREAAVAKKEQLAEEKAKREQEEQEIVEDPVESYEPEEPVEDVLPIPKPVARRVRAAPRPSLSLTDDLRSEILQIVRDGIRPQETKEEKKKRKLEEAYQYMIARQNEPSGRTGGMPYKKPAEVVQQGQSDLYKQLFF